MAFAGHCGVSIALRGWAASRVARLFAEELGAVIQLRYADMTASSRGLHDAGLGA